MIMITTTFYYQKSNFFKEKNKSNNIIANHNNYTNLKIDSDDFSLNFMIQSKVITDSYLKVTLPFHKVIENRIVEFNSGLKPDKDTRGLHSTIEIGFDVSKNNAKYKLKQDSLRVEYVKTLNTIYSLKIDSITYKTDFIIDKVSRDKFSFETYLGIQNLSEGKHILTISRLLKRDSEGKKVLSKIPFWYFKN